MFGNGERGEKLRIFNINHRKAPTFAQITLSLTETNDNSNDGVNVVNWLADVRNRKYNAKTSLMMMYDQDGKSS